MSTRELIEREVANLPEALQREVYDFARFLRTKDAERRRLRALPWLEKLEILDRLRERRLVLGAMKPHPKNVRPV